MTVAAPRRGAVVGDAEALGRAVENLLANALTHGRGAVTVTVAAAARAARLAVADEGPGLPPAQAEAAFERSGAGPGPRRAPAPGSGWRSCAPPRGRTAGDVDDRGGHVHARPPPAGTAGAIVREPSEQGRTVQGASP